MGTVFKQPPRSDYGVSISMVEGWLMEIIDIAKRHNVEVTDVIEVYKSLELSRQNNLDRANGDIHDEQLSGLAELLKNVDERLQILAEQLKRDGN